MQGKKHPPFEFKRLDFNRAQTHSWLFGFENSIMYTLLSLLSLLCAAVVAASPLEQRDTITSIVNLGNNTGTPQHLASGFIYGIPDHPDQIPDHFYTNIGFNYARAGGAQVAAPGGGWIWGLSEYKVPRLD